MFRVYLDLETTSVRYDCEIAQIGGVAILASTWQILETFEKKLIIDESKAIPEALATFGYNPVIWKEEAVAPELALAHFDDFVLRYKSIERTSKDGSKKYKTTQAVAHNASFDKDRLDNFYKKYDMFCPVDYKWWDTLQFTIFFDSLVGINRASHSLGAICKDLGINRVEPHNALSDALACMEVHRFIDEQLRPTFAI